jgi:hypothetical protein
VIFTTNRSFVYLSPSKFPLHLQALFPLLPSRLPQFLHHPRLPRLPQLLRLPLLPPATMKETMTISLTVMRFRCPQIRAIFFHCPCYWSDLITGFVFSVVALPYTIPALFRSSFTYLGLPLFDLRLITEIGCPLFID